MDATVVLVVDDEPQIRRLVRSRKGVSRLNKSTGAFFVGAGGLMLGVNNH
jgi:hypothetical protein